MFYPIAGAGDQVDMEAMADDKLKGPGKTTDWQRALPRCKKTGSRFFVPPRCMLGFAVPMVRAPTKTVAENMVPTTHDKIMVKALKIAKLWELCKNDLGFRDLPATDLRTEPAIHGYNPYDTIEDLEKEPHNEQINARVRTVYVGWLEFAVSQTLTQTQLCVSVRMCTDVYGCIRMHGLTYICMCLLAFVCT
jgi:hypothetical protein